MSLETLRKAVEARTSDSFEVGTVVRWTMKYDSSDTEYLYAAIKTEIGWITTSRVGGGTVPLQMSFAKMLEILAMPEARNVAVSSGWTQIEGSGAAATATGPATHDVMAELDRRAMFFYHKVLDEFGAQRRTEDLRRILVDFGMDPSTWNDR